MFKNMQEYIDGQLQQESPVLCKYKVGDLVTYTNDYGASFEELTIIGFSKPDCHLLKYGSFIHLDTGCYWMPVKPESLCVGPAAKIDKDLILGNGQKATHVGYEFFGRPIYRLENGTTVCCINNDGADLHLMSTYGEPISSLPEEYQAIY